MTGEVLFGTQGFGYARWVGVFYPRGTKSEGYLPAYAQQFGLVELDTTYYHAPTARLVDRWAEASPDGFCFTAKVPKSITQERKLVEVEDDLSYFFGVMRRFGPKLGPLLFQMSPNFRYPDDWPALTELLPELPDDLELAIEFRHRSWWRDDVEGALAERGVAWVLNDLPYLPRATEQPRFLRTTAPFTYIRLLGDHHQTITQDRVQFDRERDLDAWAALIGTLRGRLSRVYVLANNHYQGHAPFTLRSLAERLAVPTGGTDEDPSDPASDGTPQPALPLFEPEPVPPAP